MTHTSCLLPSIFEARCGKFSETMFPSRDEAARDQTENAFTGILRRVFRAVPTVLSAVFVDLEGECIDYVAAYDPYEVKVGAAHMHVLIEQLRQLRMADALGETFAFELVTDEREVWVRRISEEYSLVVLLGHGFDASELRDAIAVAGRQFREEGDLPAPTWEGRERLSVRVRTSPRWEYAPAAFSLRGRRFEIAAVLGRWTEPALLGGPGWVCFRVRTPQGEELTLAHDARTEAWRVRGTMGGSFPSSRSDT